MNEEIWKEIDGYQDYEISSLGNYRRKIPVSGSRGHGYPLKPKKMKDGYLMACLSKDKKQKNVNLHRLVAKAFIPNPENKKEVNHKNLIKDDNRLENLEWVTPSENIQHARRNRVWKNREPGKNGRNSKLTQIIFYPGMTATKEGKREYMRQYHKITGR